MPRSHASAVPGFPSPVPTQTMSGSAWKTATDPIPSTRWSSKTDSQLRPPFLDFHTPPVAAPTKTTFGSDSTASIACDPTAHPGRSDAPSRHGREVVRVHPLSVGIPPPSEDEREEMEESDSRSAPRSVTFWHGPAPAWNRCGAKNGLPSCVLAYLIVEDGSRVPVGKGVAGEGRDPDPESTTPGSPRSRLPAPVRANHIRPRPVLTL